MIGLIPKHPEGLIKYYYNTLVLMNKEYFQN
jgi:hypothetical protein